MKKIIKHTLLLGILIYSSTVSAQKGVGINTTDLSPGSALQIESTIGALVIPRMTETQMMTIQDVLDGAIVFNTTDKNWYMRINGVWTPYLSYDTPSLILNKEGGFLTLSSDPIHIPLNNTNVVSNAPAYFELAGSPSQNATIKVLRQGLYVVTAGMSTTNLPTGPRKFKVLLYVNGSLASYLTSGYVKLDQTDWWGTSGNSPVYLQANDLVEIKYQLEGSGEISGKFFNIGISKM